MRLKPGMSLNFIGNLKITFGCVDCKLWFVEPSLPSCSLLSDVSAEKNVSASWFGGVEDEGFKRENKIVSHKIKWVPIGLIFFVFERFCQSPSKIYSEQFFSLLNTIEQNMEVFLKINWIKFSTHYSVNEVQQF